MTAGVTLEQTALGHALNDPECFIQFSKDLSADDFAVPNHKVIAFCMNKMSDRGITLPDEDTFQLFVDAYPGEEKDYGGAEYIRTLKKGYKEPTENYQLIVRQLKLQSVKAAIGSSHLEKILKAINNPVSSAADVRSALDSAVASLETIEPTTNEFVDSVAMSEVYVRELDERAARPFFTTGMPALDDLMTEGFVPKKLSVLAGFTGMAKSTTAIAMAHRIAVLNIGVGFFSMEAQKEGVWDKLVSSLTQIPVLRLKKESGSLSVDERQRIDNALGDLQGLPLLINDRASMSMAEMRHQIVSAKRRGYDISVVFVDLFGKLEDVDSGDNLAAKIQQKLKQTRVMAQELDVHFVLIVQVGRQGFGRTRSGNIRRPTLIDLKNSNAYAEEPDNVLLVHRNKYYLPDLADDILEIHIAKQRDGEAGTVCYFEMFAERSTIMTTNKRPHDIGS